VCTTLVTKHKSTSKLLSTNTGDQRQDKGKAAKALILIPNKHQQHPTTRVKFRQLKNCLGITMACYTQQQSFLLLTSSIVVRIFKLYNCIFTFKVT
jgi:hypothetical protein